MHSIGRRPGFGSHRARAWQRVLFTISKGVRAVAEGVVETGVMIATTLQYLYFHNLLPRTLLNGSAKLEEVSTQGSYCGSDKSANPPQNHRGVSEIQFRLNSECLTSSVIHTEEPSRVIEILW